MSTQTLISMVNELKELEAMAHELNEEIETIKDSIKEFMTAQNTNELVAGSHIIRWTEVVSNRLDTSLLKKTMPEIFKAYTKQSLSRRFTIS